MVQVGPELRIGFVYQVQRVAKNDKVPLTVVRADKTMKVEIPASPRCPMPLQVHNGDCPSGRRCLARGVKGQKAPRLRGHPPGMNRQLRSPKGQHVPRLSTIEVRKQVLPDQLGPDASAVLYLNPLCESGVESQGSPRRIGQRPVRRARRIVRDDTGRIERRQRTGADLGLALGGRDQTRRQDVDGRPHIIERGVPEALKVCSEEGWIALLG